MWRESPKVRKEKLGDPLFRAPLPRTQPIFRFKLAFSKPGSSRTWPYWALVAFTHLISWSEYKSFRESFWSPWEQNPPGLYAFVRVAPWFPYRLWVPAGSLRAGRWADWMQFFLPWPCPYVRFELSTCSFIFLTACYPSLRRAGHSWPQKECVYGSSPWIAQT